MLAKTPGKTPSRVAFADYAAQVITTPYGQSVDSSCSMMAQSSTLSSINSQLLTHGWAKRPLNLNALAEKDFNEVVAVLFELIGAGVSNVETVDALSARHRTLTYEFERLQKTHHVMRNANARMEIEVEGWKAKCAEVQKRVGQEEEKNKGLRDEVARGKRAMDGVRIAAGPGQSPLLEQSLRELADIRESLQEETEAFRHVIVSTGNGLREALALAAGEEPPHRLAQAQFFASPTASSASVRPLATSTGTHQSSSSTSHPTIADARLRSLLSELRTRLLSPDPVAPRIASLTNVEQVMEEEDRAKEAREKEKIRRDLEERVKDLEVEVECGKAREEEAKQVLAEYTRAQMQASLARVAKEQDGEKDALEETLAREKGELDEERKKFTEAAVRLGQERRQLEIERVAFLEEKRKADVEDMLALLPATPEAVPSKSASLFASPSPVPSPFLTASASPLPSTLQFHLHRPHSPSPLSPSHHNLNKPRTPKSHAVNKRRGPKTPLARLVMEKAVREKGKSMATESEKQRLSSALSSEGGRRTNATASTSTSTRLKESTSGGSSTTAKKSVSPSEGVGSLVRTVDLSKSEGVGPRGAARGGRIWR
ncbi:hypothetical protein P7C73_g2366, partial [Tremellales sp. Uapishka_1]